MLLSSRTDKSALELMIDGCEVPHYRDGFLQVSACVWNALGEVVFHSTRSAWLGAQEARFIADWMAEIAAGKNVQRLLSSDSAEGCDFWFSEDSEIEIGLLDQSAGSAKLFVTWTASSAHTSEASRIEILAASQDLLDAAEALRSELSSLA